MVDIRKKKLCGCGLSGTFPLCDGKHTVHNGIHGTPMPCGTPNEAPVAVSRAPETADEMQS